MQDTFHNLGVGLVLASLLMYFLMVGLDRSFIVPLTVMLVVPDLAGRRAADAVPHRHGA